MEAAIKHTNYIALSGLYFANILDTIGRCPMRLYNALSGLTLDSIFFIIGFYPMRLYGIPSSVELRSTLIDYIPSSAGLRPTLMDYIPSGLLSPEGTKYTSEVATPLATNKNPGRVQQLWDSH
jgi:hypothetical protein